jgi:hypothetical protein
MYKIFPSQIINYQHVSIAFAIGAASQEYEEYNNLSHWTQGTTKMSQTLSSSTYTFLQFTVFLVLL